MVEDGNLGLRLGVEVAVDVNGRLFDRARLGRTRGICRLDRRFLWLVDYHPACIRGFHKGTKNLGCFPRNSRDKVKKRPASLQHAVHHLQLAVPPRGQAMIVRHHQQRLLAVPRQLQKQIHNNVARLGIEIPGRLIGKDNVGIVG